MTVPAVTPAGKRYVANGSTLNFVYDFAIKTVSDILVLMDGAIQIYGSHYSLTGVGSTNGGQVQFFFFPPDGTPITILRAQSISQLVNFLVNSSYDPPAVGRALDNLSAVDQMLAERIDRALKFAEKSTKRNIVVDDPTPLGFLRFNADGDGVESSLTLQLPTVIEGTAFPSLFNPVDDDAVGNDIADDTAELQALGARVQAAGGGHIIFPAGKTYKVYSAGQALTPLFNFINLKNVTIDFNGSQIKVYHNFVGTGLILFLFVFDGCKFVTIRGQDVKQVTGVTVPGAVEGVTSNIFMRGCEHINVQTKLDGGVVPLQFQRSTATEGLNMISSKATFDVNSINSIYGFSCADSGNDLRGRIVTRNVMRSYIVYGCNNHDMEISSSNAQSNDCLIVGGVVSTGTPTLFAENLNLRYRVMGRTIGEAPSYLTIGMAQDIANAVLKNITVDMEADYTGEPGTGGLPPAVTFIKAGAASQNMLFENIDIKCKVRSLPNVAGDLFNIFNSAQNPWSGETARNVKLCFQVEGGATPEWQMNLHPFSGNDNVCILEDCKFPGALDWTNIGATNLSFRGLITPTRRDRDIFVVFTPLWTAAGGGAAIGDGVLTGILRRQGKMANVTIQLTIGSTTNPGTGAWTFTAPNQQYINDLFGAAAIGTAYALDNGTAHFVGAVISKQDLSAASWTIVTSGGAAEWQSNQPFTWVAGDFMFFTVTYPLNQ